MTDNTQLLKEQEQLLTTLKRYSSKFDVRITRKQVNTYDQEIEALWQQFDRNDQVLQNTLSLDDAYIVNQFPDKAKKYYDNLKTLVLDIRTRKFFSDNQPRGPSTESPEYDYQS